jgi:hypothetical protein
LDGAMRILAGVSILVVPKILLPGPQLREMGIGMLADPDHMCTACTMRVELDGFLNLKPTSINCRSNLHGLQLRRDGNVA